MIRWRDPRGFASSGGGRAVTQSLGEGVVAKLGDMGSLEGDKRALARKWRVEQRCCVSG